MDYKYIEQLLERYWNCETSLEEEQILRSFFHQKEIPAHLLRYKAMFAYQEIEKEMVPCEMRSAFSTSVLLFILDRNLPMIKFWRFWEPLTPKCLASFCEK